MIIPTKLVLLEGPPGSGKTTTAQKLADEISASGAASQCFLEWSPDNPIAIGDDQHLDRVVATAIAREDEVLRQWQRFAEARQAQDLVTVMESRFWQTSIMLMVAAGHPREAVIASSQRIVSAIQPLRPVLIFFQIDDFQPYIDRTIQIKEEEWRRDGFEGSWAQHIFVALEPQVWFTDRGLSGLEGLIAFMADWALVTQELYRRLPFPKISIRNPHLDWPSAMQQMREFLELGTPTLPPPNLVLDWRIPLV